MRKISLWQTVNDAYDISWKNGGAFASIVGIWIVALTALATLTAVPPLVAFADKIPVAVRIAQILGVLIFSLAWLRCILRDEKPRLIPRVSREALRFIGYTLLVAAIFRGVLYFGGFILLLVLSAAALGLGLMPIPSWATYWFQVAEFILLLTPFSGFLLALPAVAAEEEGHVLARSWRRSNGNRIRLACGALLCIVPFEGIGLAIEQMFDRPLWPSWTGRQSELAQTLVSPQVLIATELDLVLSFLGAATLLSFVALAYQQLAASDQPAVI